MSVRQSEECQGFSVHQRKSRGYRRPLRSIRNVWAEDCRLMAGCLRWRQTVSRSD